MAKIAIVDDAPEVIQLITKILRSTSHELLSYQDTEGLEEQLAASAPDLLLLDVVMPGRSGFQVLRGLKKREETKDMPVILVSSKSQESDIQWGKTQGANDYLTKPFTPEQLLAAVNRFVN